jgi:hypothetical protein
MPPQVGQVPGRQRLNKRCSISRFQYAYGFGAFKLLFDNFLLKLLKSPIVFPGGELQSFHRRAYNLG